MKKIGIGIIITLACLLVSVFIFMICLLFISPFAPAGFLQETSDSGIDYTKLPDNYKYVVYLSPVLSATEYYLGGFIAVTDIKATGGNGYESGTHFFKYSGNILSWDGNKWVDYKKHPLKNYKNAPPEHEYNILKVIELSTGNDIEYALMKLNDDEINNARDAKIKAEYDRLASIKTTYKGIIISVINNNTILFSDNTTATTRLPIELAVGKEYEIVIDGNLNIVNLVMIDK